MEKLSIPFGSGWAPHDRHEISWGKILGGVGAAVGGLVTGGATWAALPAIIGGAGTALQGITESRASKRAAQQQMAGGQRAIGRMDEAVGAIKEGFGPLKSAIAAQNAAYGRASDVYAGLPGLFDPYREAGEKALGTINDLLERPPGELTPGDVDPWLSPGMAHRLKYGNQAIERSAAAKGNLLTGGTLRDLTDYSQGVAAQEYDAAYGRARDAFDRELGVYDRRVGLASQLAGMGYGSVGQLAGLGRSFADMTMGLGDQQAGIYRDMANVWGNIGGVYGDMSDIETQIANAQAAGTIGSGKAWSDTIGGITNTIGDAVAGWQARRDRGGVTGGWMPGRNVGMEAPILKVAGSQTVGGMTPPFVPYMGG